MRTIGIFYWRALFMTQGGNIPLYKNIRIVIII